MSESEKSELAHTVSTPAKGTEGSGQAEGAGVPGVGAVTIPPESAMASGSRSGGAGWQGEADAVALNEISVQRGDAERVSAPVRSPEPEAISAPTLDVDREDDEETWTNQPARGEDLPPDEDEFDEDDGGEEVDEPPPVARKQIQNARDVVCEELPFRAARAKARLRPHLSGTLAIELFPSRDRFLFDWRGDEARVIPLAAPVSLAQNEPADESKVDAIISVHEQHLMQIRSGDLNPQLAILADKVRVAGKVAPAVYFFNLIAPRDREL